LQITPLLSFFCFLGAMWPFLRYAMIQTSIIFIIPQLSTSSHCADTSLLPYLPLLPGSKPWQGLVLDSGCLGASSSCGEAKLSLNNDVSGQIYFNRQSKYTTAEALLDWVEIGRVWWQEYEETA